MFDQPHPKHVAVAGETLHCLLCGHDLFWSRKAQLNTSVASFFGADWANPSALCHICDACGYVHWFLPPNTPQL